MNKARLEQVRSVVETERQRALRMGEVEDFWQSEVCIPMKARPGGLTGFEIIGTAGSRVLFASWDGLELTLSGELSRPLLPTLTTPLTRIDRPWHSPDPQWVAIRLVQALDYIVTIKYGVFCDHCDREQRWRVEPKLSVQCAEEPIAG
jgi:hypothetical protein